VRQFVSIWGEECRSDMHASCEPCRR
jgi:hypothetical protein